MSYLSRSSGSVSPDFRRHLSPDSISSRSGESDSPTGSPPPDDHSDDQGPSTAGRAPRRSEYAAYAALLREWKPRKPHHGITHRLWQLSTPRSSVQPPSSVAPSSADETEVNSPTALTAHDQVAALSSRLDDRWPLERSALPPTDSMDEMVRATASRLIRSARLVLPPRPAQDGQADGQTDLDDVDDHEDLPLPPDLVQRTTEFVNRVLVGLAAMRPCETRAKRKRMQPIGWEGVMGAASLSPEDERVVRNANARLMQLYRRRESLDPPGQDQPDDLHRHRLDALRRLRGERRPATLDEMYAPVLPAQPKPKRIHQSPAELERRAAKRKARLEQRQAKEAAKVEAKRLGLEERRAKRATRRGLVEPAHG